MIKQKVTELARELINFSVFATGLGINIGGTSSIFSQVVYKFKLAFYFLLVQSLKVSLK